MELKFLMIYLAVHGQQVWRLDERRKSGVWRLESLVASISLEESVGT